MSEMRVKAVHRRSNPAFIDKPFFKYLKRRNERWTRVFISLDTVNNEYD